MNIWIWKQHLSLNQTMITNISKASITVGLLGVTILAATPAMANTARREAKQMRQVNRALRQDFKAQNRYIRNKTYNSYYSPTPIYNPSYVRPNPGTTVRYWSKLSTTVSTFDPATRGVPFLYFVRNGIELRSFFNQFKRRNPAALPPLQDFDASIRGLTGSGPEAHSGHMIF